MVHEMIKRETVGFPIDRSLAGIASGTGVTADAAMLTIDGRPLPLSRSAQADIDGVCFAVLFVFARMLGQVFLQLPVAIGNEETPDRYTAHIAPENSLAEAYSTLRRDGPPDPCPEIEMLVVEQLAPGGWRPILRVQRGSEQGGPEQGGPGQLALSLMFDPAAIARVSAQDFLEKIAIVVEALRARPDIPCGDLDLSTDTSRTLIPDLSCALLARGYDFVPATFFDVAAQYADHPAIASDTQSYLYRELACVVCKLAAELRHSGLQPGEVVAVSGVSSFGMLASVLAVLAAGGVLVIVDRGLPEHRQQQVSDLCQPRRRIEVRTKADACRAGENTLVTTDWPDRSELTGTAQAEVFAVDLAPDASAYVFFTSGSTGLPKGVLGTHLGLAHFLDWQRSRFPIGPGDRTAQLTALSFDVVLRDILFPLTSGACVHIPKRELLLDAPRMLAWLATTKITAMHCVPSLMKAWLHAHTAGKPFQSLRTIFFAGEPLTDSLLQRFFALAGPDTRAVNLYGPTETTLAKLACPIQRIEPGVQPIGNPQPGVDVMVFRGRRVPCGLWETGEIAIRTPYRSKGYFGNDELTRQAFVPNPWRNDPADVLYHTGDLGRYRSDGKLEIFGRSDAQIKIRGVRIEPAEIEGLMLQHPRVADAAITTRVGANGDKNLLALVVVNAPLGAEAHQQFSADIRDDLKTTLHAAMVPARIIVADRIPYLPNGKLDRKSINAMDLDVRGLASAGSRQLNYSNARTKQLIQGIEEALNAPIEDVGKSFIELGGDSLSYVRVSILLEELLGSLPEGWAEKPVSEFLQRLEEPALPQVRSAWVKFDVTLLFRAIAIVLVCVSHIKDLSFIMATSTLFVISGMNFARFLRPALKQSGELRPTLNLILKFGIPAALWQSLRMIALHRVWLPDLFLLGTFVQNPADPHLTLWFLDILAANLVLLGLIGAAGALIRHRRYAGGAASENKPGNSFWIDLCWLAGGLGIAFVQVDLGWGDGVVGKTGVAPFKWFWMLALGILMTQADSIKKKVVVSLILGGLAMAAYSGIPEIAAPFAQLDEFFFASVLLMIWVDRLAVPRVLQKPLSIVAAATLFIYIVNYSVINHLMPKLGLGDQWTLSVVVAMAAGILAKALWDKITAQLRAAAPRVWRRGAEPVKTLSEI